MNSQGPASDEVLAANGQIIIKRCDKARLRATERLSGIVVSYDLC